MSCEFNFIGKLCKITEEHWWFVFPTKEYSQASRAIVPIAYCIVSEENCRRLGMALGCEITLLTKGDMFVPLEYHTQGEVVKILTREGNISWVDADIKFYLEDVCKDIAT